MTVYGWHHCIIFECLNEKQNGFIRGWKENESSMLEGKSIEEQLMQVDIHSTKELKRIGL